MKKKVSKTALIHQLMEYSDPPAWKWLKLWATYEEMSMNRLLEIRTGFRAAIRGLERRKQA